MCPQGKELSAPLFQRKILFKNTNVSLFLLMNFNRVMNGDGIIPDYLFWLTYLLYSA